MPHANFSSVFDEQDAFVFGYESAKGAQKCRLTRTRAAADQNVLPSENIAFQAIGERLVERPESDQILDLEMAWVELADRKGHAAQTAGRNNRSDAAAIGEPGVKNGLRLRELVS